MAKSKDKEREVRLRPPKPMARGERRLYSFAYRMIMHHSRMSGVRRRRLTGFGSRGTRIRPYSQRCAVRVVYSKNSRNGQWRAHGRYVARESATHEGDPRAVGFNTTEESIDIAARLAGWQAANDERLWKLIVSPEFGDRVDLKRLTRDLISKMEIDLGTRLEWVAAAHFNTEHPHVHVALRGVGAEGQPLRLSRDFVREGIRHITEDLCTRQLGYRTELDAADAQRREVRQHRYTSLDRIIQRDANKSDAADTPFFTVNKDPSRTGVVLGTSLIERRAAERLMVLESIGLAESDGPKKWRVRRDFANILRAMQHSADRQKTLAAHGALISDERLQMTVLDLQDVTTLEGRILVHGEEESSGRSYLMLEGTDARVHYVHYTPEIEAARARGGLRTNAFIQLRNLTVDGHTVLEIEDMGDSEALLRNNRKLHQIGQRLMRAGFVPEDEGWNGWLGRYQKALRDAATILETPNPTKVPGRDKNRYRGR